MNNTENNCNMIIAEMDKIKDDLFWDKLCSIADKQYRLEKKMDLILELLNKDMTV